MKGGRFVVISLFIFVSLILLFNPTGKVTEDNGTLITEDGGTDGVVCAQNSIEKCDGAYISGYEDGCPVYDCPSCNEGDVKKYTCSNGIKVDWCHCSNNLWTCVNSPESACQLETCSGITCANNVAPYFTGSYEENCPVYSCPEWRCTPGLASEYVCPDGTSVPDCKCTYNGNWQCIEHPEEKCSTPICPQGCICNGNVITCPAGNYTTEATETSPTTSGGGAGESIELCPAGCLCTDEQIVCEQNLTAKGNCAMGCELNGNCLLPGIRTSINDSKEYCDINSEWKVQKVTDETCDNNFECETNLCINGKCITQNFLDKIFAWFSNLFGGSKN